MLIFHKASAALKTIAIIMVIWNGISKFVKDYPVRSILLYLFVPTMRLFVLQYLDRLHILFRAIFNILPSALL